MDQACSHPNTRTALVLLASMASRCAKCMPPSVPPSVLENRNADDADAADVRGSDRNQIRADPPKSASSAFLFFALFGRHWIVGAHRRVVIAGRQPFERQHQSVPDAVALHGLDGIVRAT